MFIMNWKIIVLKLLRIFLELLSRFIFFIVYNGKPHVQLPPIKNLILLESGTSLAKKIRTKKLKSEEIVKSFIARIKEINPILNCVVDERFKDALEEAKVVDDLINSNEYDEEALAKNKPFLGVPFTTKDCFSVKGLKQTAGSWFRRNFIAESDADVISLMRKAGAIPLCVTNVSELCMWWESANTLYGRTNNPYKTCCIVGGSSGGEACLQAACGSPLGIGSDIGGSIRMPAFFNGVFGHKPSLRIVSNDGQEPVAVGEALDFLVTGPLCKYATDLIPMFQILASSNARLLKLNEKVNIRDIKLYYMEDDGGSAITTPVHPEIKAAMKRVIVHFEKAYGVKAMKVNLKTLKSAVYIYFAKLGGVEEANTFCEELALKKGSINVWLELIKCIFRISKHTLPALMLGIFEKFNMRVNDPEGYAKIIAKSDGLKREFKELLGDDGVFLFPTHPTPAPFHGQPVLRPFNFVYTGIFNIMGVPVTHCPLGLSSEGLPIGIQAVANHYHDHLTIAVAQELERAFGGWISPSEVN